MIISLQYVTYCGHVSVICCVTLEVSSKQFRRLAAPSWRTCEHKRLWQQQNAGYFHQQLEEQLLVFCVSPVWNRSSDSLTSGLGRWWLCSKCKNKLEHFKHVCTARSIEKPFVYNHMKIHMDGSGRSQICKHKIIKQNKKARSVFCSLLVHYNELWCFGKNCGKVTSDPFNQWNSNVTGSFMASWHEILGCVTNLVYGIMSSDQPGGLWSQFDRPRRECDYSAMKQGSQEAPFQSLSPQLAVNGALCRWFEQKASI